MVDHAGVGLSFTKACLRQSFHSVHHVDSCASTSALAKEWGTRGERHGSIFVASQQTQGRGRQGRSGSLTKADSLFRSI